MSSKSRTVLSISQKVPPETNPTAIRSSKTLKYLPKDWQIHVLSGNQEASLEQAHIHFARSWYPGKLLRFIRGIKFGKLLDWLVWPDEDIFWLLPAVFKGVNIIKTYDIDLIIVFLKPYSAGIIGILLKWLTGKPLVINVCEPSTCDDLYGVFPTKFHYYLSRWLEDIYVRQSDAIIYVSQLSLELVRSRQAKDQYSKFHLIRGGADPQDFQGMISGNTVSDDFEIVFTGGMTGWEEFLELPKQGFVKRLRHAWMNWGRYFNVNVNPASSSPIFIGRAIKQVIAQHPRWSGKIKLKLYGNQFESAATVLENQNLSDVVSVTGPIPYFDALQKLQTANLLFMPLPDRLDGTPGDRISLKTYEYLMTDRPILAAVPPGENQNYLREKPGVYLVNPFDIEAMARVIEQLAIKHMAGETLVVDRVETQKKISYSKRGDELTTLILDVLNQADDGKSFTGTLIMGTTKISGQR
ncbi:group 1 glycosyl transferase [Leptolyngbya sp. Heron Island J]|uniref:glycosyltransferase n=1 Tax=Leptolyngbya sp. Heron Island J TaxID=1385935 RepID=UPI0003B944E8|nr:glycosyltransferase [Leptolyngbya sp. Heron Island J]ESA38661.1 group 1 glycosyl transferase [Leptolyngbya sp. Heron Island J]